MFEKDAEEFANRKGHEHYNYLIEENAGSPADFARCCFKDGAEFGYNKANEWHYVKDGDLPKDEKDMLMSDQLILLTRMKGTNNLSISIGQYNFSTQEFSYPHFVGLTEVIAWKEIVLPELKESE